MQGPENFEELGEPYKGIKRESAECKEGPFTAGRGEQSRGEKRKKSEDDVVS